MTAHTAEFSLQRSDGECPEAKSVLAGGFPLQFHMLANPQVCTRLAPRRGIG